MQKTKYITLLIITFTLTVLCEKKAEFIEPAPGTQIYSSTCTLHINTPYPVDSTSFSVEFLSNRGTIKKRKIGVLTREPFRVLLKTDNIPNQYFNGATINAELYKGDTLEVLKATHIYIMPDKIPIDTVPLFQKGYTSKKKIQFKSPAKDFKSSIKFNYKNDNLRIKIDVKSLIKKLESKHNLANQVVSVILDPTMNRYPYINNNIVTCDIPLDPKKAPQLISTYIDTINNTFTIQRTPTTIQLKKQIKVMENGSYYLDFEIPPLLTGGTIPEKMGINIIAPHPFNGSTISLVDGGYEKQMAPIVYPILKKEVGTIAHITTLRTFFIALLIGGAIALLLLPITFLLSKVQKKMKTTKISTIDIVNEISQEILNPSLDDTFLSNKLKVSKQELQKNCYTITGKKVNTYINWLRVELIKERLISSNSNEIDIAKSCGYEKVAQMEAVFLKVVGIAPYQYREKHKISFPTPFNRV